MSLAEQIADFYKQKNKDRQRIKETIQKAHDQTLLAMTNAGYTDIQRFITDLKLGLVNYDKSSLPDGEIEVSFEDQFVEISNEQQTTNTGDFVPNYNHWDIVAKNLLRKMPSRKKNNR